MTRKELSQIYYLNREIKMWKEKLDTITSNVNATGMHEANRLSDITYETMVKKDDICAIIEDRLRELKKKQLEIMRFINGIDDSLVRQIMQYRFVECMPWRKISERVYNRSDKEDLVRIICKRYLKQHRIF